jgi:SAM-dependent methyltransferase
MTPLPTSREDWLRSRMGRQLLALERALVAETLDEVFGAQLLQIGRWGAADAFLAAARTQRTALLDTGGGEVSFRSEPEHLAVATHCVDAVLLPHTLERSGDPHQILREVDRILISDGRLIILGFSPVGPLGLWRLASRGRYPAGVPHIVRLKRMREWLAVLGFDVLEERRYFYAVSPGGDGWPRYSAKLEQRGRRYWRRLSCAYMLHAQKRVLRVIPIGKVLRRRQAPVVGLVEPSTRSAARFESR